MLGSKRFRTLCLLLCLSVLLAAFSVSVSAASDNLVDSDLSNWENLDGSDNISVVSSGNIYRLSSYYSGSNYFLGFLYDLPSFVAGHSYSLSFKLPSGSDIGSAFGVTWTDDNSINYYKNTTVLVGYGFLSADGTSIDTQVVLYEFNSSNISKYLGKTLKTSFVAGSSSGRPVVYIGINTNDTNYHHFYFSDFVMFDNDDNSKELTGIKGFLHSIRWDLVGGICDDEDCPHSSSVNPHLSLTERMSAGFSTMFENIGNKFEEGSTLHIWFNNLSSGVTDLGDRVDGFFDGLGDRISGFFDNLKSGITSGFSDVGSWFTNLGNNLSAWFDGVKLKFQEIADKFTEFFEKFKPRVYMNFTWIRGLVDEKTGVVTTSVDKPYIEDLQYVIISEPFKVSPDMKYIVDYNSTGSNYYFLIHQYDYYGNYIGVIKKTNSSFTGFELPSGFIYRFRTGWTPGDTDLDVLNDYVLVYAEEGWINALVHKLQNTIKGLFIPDDSFLTTWKSNLQLTLEQHLGFIYTALDFVGDFFTKLKDLLSAQSDGIPEFVLPEVDFELNGVRYDLWSEKTIELSFLNDGIWGTLYGLYKVILYIIIIFALLNYGVTVYGRIMHQ